MEQLWEERAPTAEKAPARNLLVLSSLISILSARFTRTAFSGFVSRRSPGYREKLGTERVQEGLVRGPLDYFHRRLGEFARQMPRSFARRKTRRSSSIETISRLARLLQGIIDSPNGARTDRRYILSR